MDIKESYKDKMKRIVFVGILVPGIIMSVSSYAFFVGFGSAPTVEQMIKKGQDEGKIPKVPDTGEHLDQCNTQTQKLSGRSHGMAEVMMGAMALQLIHQAMSM